MKKLIYFMMALLGFTACDRGMVEYGVPVSDFSLKARVVDKDDNPIKGIEVHGGYNRDNLEAIGYTNDNGEFSMHTDETNRDEVDMPTYLYFVDVDGAENGGEFSSPREPILVNYEMAEQDGWYSRYEAELSVELKVKESSENDGVE